MILIDEEHANLWVHDQLKKVISLHQLLSNVAVVIDVLDDHLLLAGFDRPRASVGSSLGLRGHASHAMGEQIELAADEAHDGRDRDVVADDYYDGDEKRRRVRYPEPPENSVGYRSFVGAIGARGVTRAVARRFNKARDVLDFPLISKIPRLPGIPRLAHPRNKDLTQQLLFSEKFRGKSLGQSWIHLFTRSLLQWRYRGGATIRKPRCGRQCRLVHVLGAAHRLQVSPSGCRESPVGKRREPNRLDKEDKSTPLHTLARLRVCDCAEFCIDNTDDDKKEKKRRPVDEIVDLLVAKGANIETRNARGFTPLELAVLLLDYELTKSLLERGASLNSLRENIAFSTDYTSSELNDYPITLYMAEMIRLLSSNGFSWDVYTRLKILRFFLRYDMEKLMLGVDRKLFNSSEFELSKKGNASRGRVSRRVRWLLGAESREARATGLGDMSDHYYWPETTVGSVRMSWTIGRAVGDELASANIAQPAVAKQLDLDLGIGSRPLVASFLEQ
ncbi:unnamed protein product [Trichogramma brassicae]|uniref:Uncharacterized protein n=1 Tax=Trichogramma brassicae TaxID=86971 RepID=A0A6H5IB15_9HYME|nr:unnamed protein product [Trichogramma brassicae]